ncbi:MAG: diphosphomevalonate decarboxylase [Brevibacterium sp.]|uniref:diphosphomevalonate decarboxylase n=1 Tax=Brevibacterium sp. TaxID=1701 RepID=UPI002647E648|nr:diphosphomevalonate decarboxylase [Brevibacterium sp.]MDN5807024.1 diphosphomevalonate decarboxylase [Brevibacterium sp.]MDN5833408.1 diphosphomevalonate decarboxylase [Brevibacterium sp.]MDN5875925.1 diphosphomevalonate decarboxylase [Brevibacterium sp.]MDN5908914.1 diphosphomevalonate decarboxylase [Brevibacterium sp.]MDN6134049.1 diphosphomevalonate decarboxylase [Brevibacterium sp.]
MRTTTARAHPNIALVKYWGKRDEERILPAAGSLSMTLDAFETTTTVVPDGDRSADVLELNGRAADAEQTERIARFLDHVRALAGSAQRVIVRSHNSVPTGAGLASSASGFAALATAAATAFDLDLDNPALSRLARLGSGSACRSVVPGMAVWHAGDDESSFAEPVRAPDMRMVIVTVDRGRKPVSSRTAMRLTAATSPFYPAWVSSTEQSLSEMVEACQTGDFTRIGEITESHALRMHALIQSTTPPIRFLRPASVAIFDTVAELRSNGLEAYATADAGPNVAVLVRPDDAAALAGELDDLGQVRIVGPGPGAQLLPEGLEVPAATAHKGTAQGGTAQEGITQEGPA